MLREAGRGGSDAGVQNLFQNSPENSRDSKGDTLLSAGFLLHQGWQPPFGRGHYWDVPPLLSCTSKLRARGSAPGKLALGTSEPWTGVSSMEGLLCS